jgi:hypothetical protein
MSIYVQGSKNPRSQISISMKSLSSSQETQNLQPNSPVSPARHPGLTTHPRRLGLAGFLLAALFVAVLTASAQVWYPAGGPAGSAPSALAGSSTAQTLIMGTFGPIYISTNYGSAWTVTTAPNLNWEGIAASADATIIYGAPSLGPIYESTDSGQTWTQTGSPATNWYAVACSSDGGTVLGAVEFGPLFLSTDAGAHWAEASAPSNFWTSVASSAAASQWGRAGFPRSPSIRTSQSMSQRILGILAQFCDLPGHRSGGPVVQFVWPMTAEQIGGLLAGHEIAVGHQSRDGTTMLGDPDALAGLDEA